MDPKWFYQADGRTCGPVTLASLQRLAREGRLGRRQTVWKEDGGERLPAESVPGLFGGDAAETEQLATAGSLDELDILLKGAPIVAPSRQPSFPHDRAASPVRDARPIESQPVRTAEDDSGFATLGFTAADLASLESAPSGSDGTFPESVDEAARLRPAREAVSHPSGESLRGSSDVVPDIDRFGLELVSRGDRHGAEATEGMATAEVLEELFGAGRRSPDSSRRTTGEGDFDLRRPGAGGGRPRVIGQTPAQTGSGIVRGARSATAAVRSGADWYSRRGGTIHGPTTLRELRSRLDRGEISLDDEVRHGVHGLWASAATLRPTPAPVEVAAAPRSFAEGGSGSAVGTAVANVPVPAAVAPATSLPNLFDQARTAGTTWCCWIDGTEYGPLSSDQLVLWIVEGRVLEEDPLRRADSPQWFPAASLSGLFERSRSVAEELQSSVHDSSVSAGAMSAGSAVGSSGPQPVVAKSETAAPAAATSVTQRAPTSAESATEAGRSGILRTSPSKPAPESTRPAREAAAAVPSGPKAASEPPRTATPASPSIPDQTRERLASNHSQAAADELRRRLGLDEREESTPNFGQMAASSVWESIKGQVAEKPWLYVFAAVLALIVGGVYAWDHVGFSNAHDRTDYELVVKLWTDFKNLRSSKPDEARWNELQNGTMEQLKPVVARLEKTANAKAPQRQQLLHAAKNYLPEMFRDSKEKPGKNETDLATAVSTAGKIIFDQNRRR